jgi:hypothetical protein
MECHGDDTPLIPNTLPLSLHKICSYSMVFNADDTSIITLFVVTGLRLSPARMCSRICISPVLSERERRGGKEKSSASSSFSEPVAHLLGLLLPAGGGNGGGVAEASTRESPWSRSAAGVRDGLLVGGGCRAQGDGVQRRP